MSLEEQEARHARELEERRVGKIRAAQFAKDVQAVFAMPEGRRLLSAFLAASCVESSALRFDAAGRADPLLMAHVAGWQDAGYWWLDILRTHCHEREVQMRAEVRREAAQSAPQEQDDD